MKNFIDQIIKEKTSCYFISPAFGDAASSTGELLSHLDGKVDIAVINIFTKPGAGKLTFSTKQFLKHSGNTNPEALYALNKQEDANALGMLSVKIHNLDFVDALWRKKKTISPFSQYIPELTSQYPTYFHIMSGNISKEDKHIEKDLQIALKTIIKDGGKKFKIFCPIGFNKHVDYLMVRNACLEAFGENCIFYSLPIEDIQDNEKTNFMKHNRLTPYSFTFSSEAKIKILKMYESQSQQFFNDNSLVFRPEMYYVPTPQAVGKLEMKVYTELTATLLHDWQQLWNKSPMKNFFNTPLWFKASIETFHYKELLLVTCYEGGVLQGILPLVLSEKYGVPAYVTPGNQYHDNSSLLLETINEQIVHALLEKVSEAGNFYLSEIRQDLTNSSLLTMSGVGIVKSSICPYLLLEPDPYRFISKKNKRIIAKKFKTAEDNLSFKIYTNNAEEQLRTLLAIDEESSKKAAFKETFSDPLLTKLLENINKLDRNSLVVAILFYKDEPICYNYGFIIDKTYIGSGTAYKEAWRHLAPGRLLAYLLLPELMKMGLTMLDFSRGYTRYKRDFAPYAYHQYALFYSSNPLIMHRWSGLESLKSFLEKHHALFEFVRKTKKMLIK